MRKTSQMYYRVYFFYHLIGSVAEKNRTSYYKIIILTPPQQETKSLWYIVVVWRDYPPNKPPPIWVQHEEGTGNLFFFVWGGDRDTIVHFYLLYTVAWTLVTEDDDGVSSLNCFVVLVWLWNWGKSDIDHREKCARIASFPTRLHRRTTRGRVPRFWECSGLPWAH